jgi:TatA/E family protein of Tat protein translocase
MSLISPVHILFIAAFALIFLGPKRLPELARALGAGMREFRDMLNGDVPRRHALEHPDDESPSPAGPFA